MQGQGFRRSKRPLSVCHTRREYSMETSHNSIKVRVRHRFGIKSDRLRVVIVYSPATGCHS